MEKKVCSNCSESFESRNQLFKHIRICSSNLTKENEKHLKRKFSGDKTGSEEKDNENENIENDNESDKEDNDETSNTGNAAHLKQQELKIVQEDDCWYRVILKPQGFPTMGSSGEETLMNSPFMRLTQPSDKPSDNKVSKEVSKVSNYKKAVPCHRLDRPTGGLLVCSKSKAAEASIMTSFRNKEVRKRYRALVSGRVARDEGTIDFPLSGQAAATTYRVVSRSRSAQYGWVSCVDLWPVTGRRHQLRKHLSALNHAIIGEARYGSALNLPREPFSHTLFLWALEVSFPHKGRPKEINEKGELDFPIIHVEIEEPAYYKEFIKIESDLAPKDDNDDNDDNNVI